MPGKPLTTPEHPLRIALVSRRYPPLIGGAEAMLRYLALALADAGAEVTVLTSRVDRELPDVETIATRQGRLEVRRLPTSPLRFVGTWVYMRGLDRALRELRPDIAYVSMLKHDAYASIAAGWAAGFPVVLRPEGAGATGDIAWQNWGRFGKTIARRCRQANAFVAISKAVREELVGADYPAERIVELPNGVPVPEKPWNRRPHWRDDPRAVFIGRLAPEKSVHTLISAWPLVLEQYPEARLTLIGEGPERARLEASVAGLGLAHRITLAGADPDAPARLRDSDLFVLPSQEEGMSLALLEAMAVGVPIVATSIPGNRKLITDYKHGRLVPPGDPEALARVILDQWLDLDHAIHMGRAARSLVRQKYSNAGVARRHLELFRRLVGAGAP